MSRTILYPDLDDSQARVVEQPKFGGPASAQAQRKNRKDEKAADGYAEKLVKYIPAEVVAFFAPLATLAQDRSGLLIALALVGLIATPAYLWQSSRRLPPKKQPLVHTYVLACC